MKNKINIALVGNPNCGKSSVFNSLTGLQQKVGNFPGVTVDKTTGFSKINETLSANITDLPGTYSLYPKRHDEWVVYNVLLGFDEQVHPDIILLVADASNLKRNLLFCSQIIDLKRPVIVALTMMDIAKNKGIKIDIQELERELGVPVVAINPRKNTGIVQLKKLISQVGSNLYKTPVNDFIDMEALAAPSVGLIKEKYGLKSKYLAWHYLLQPESFFKDRESQEFYTGLQEKYPFNKTKIQAEEILLRYRKIKLVMRLSVVEEDPLKKSLFTQKLDNLLLHRVWGYLILLVVLFLLFQSMFWFARYPMSLVETGFAQLSGFLSRSLPVNYLSDLLVNGLLAGLSGILVFVPQIMILFGLITLLEDTGYMARISFLSDRLMRTAGLNGKSVVPMISGFACAVPAIMSARNIENKKERLLTILITPLMSCSARLPVYSVLIALVIPDKFVAGIFNIQGLVMLGLYLLGLILAMGISWFFSKLIKIKEKSFFLLELPIYRAPRWGNIASTMILKARIFVMQAGKVIMMISMVLWILSSFGPGKSMSKISEKYSRLYQQQPGLKDSLKKLESAEKLENSFAGILGKTIEPAIRPLGYDWKIGIALICSFAAREVFVGTMATLYSVGEGEKDSEKKLTEKMKQAKFENGKPVYTLASGVGLMIFYALAMQCMSTLAVVKRETKSWKWPVIQFCYMTVLAYVFSWLAYIILK